MADARATELNHEAAEVEARAAEARASAIALRRGADLEERALDVEHGVARFCGRDGDCLRLADRSAVELEDRVDSQGVPLKFETDQVNLSRGETQTRSSTGPRLTPAGSGPSTRARNDERPLRTT